MIENHGMESMLKRRSLFNLC